MIWVIISYYLIHYLAYYTSGFRVGYTVLPDLVTYWPEDIGTLGGVALLFEVCGNNSLFSAEVAGGSARFGDPLTYMVEIGVSMHTCVGSGMLLVVYKNLRFQRHSLPSSMWIRYDLGPTSPRHEPFDHSLIACGVVVFFIYSFSC